MGRTNHAMAFFAPALASEWPPERLVVELVVVVHSAPGVVSTLTAPAGSFKKLYQHEAFSVS